MYEHVNLHKKVVCSKQCLAAEVTKVLRRMKITLPIMHANNGYIRNIIDKPFEKTLLPVHAKTTPTLT